jgi:hypothetical protein
MSKKNKGLVFPIPYLHKEKLSGTDLIGDAFSHSLYDIGYVY